GLDARGGVDEVSGDHSLALGADRDRGLPGEDADARSQLRRAHLVAECGHGGGQVERGTDGPLGVVLLCNRRSPNRHHRVADELLHRAPVERDQTFTGLEVAREELPHFLCITRLGERGETDQIGEQDRDQPALGDRSLRHDKWGNGLRKLRPAFTAELLSRLARPPAGRTQHRQRASALTAELVPGRILGTAVWAGSHARSLERRNPLYKRMPEEPDAAGRWGA